VTFGIAPTRPETGYGYIRTGAPLAAMPEVLEVRRFVEKPERAAAAAMIAEGGHLWNSGMFLFRADRILAEIGAHAPRILESVEQAFAALRQTDEGGFAIPEDRYRAVPAAPIDKAVMERAARIAVVPCDPGWSDLGSWQALWEQLPKDPAGNAARGDAVLDRAENCLVHAERRLVACAGVRDLAVIETDDAILVADRNDTDAGRRLVAMLSQRGRAEATAHAEEEQPWGSRKTLREGPGFKVTEIVVAPGGHLSLPSRRERAGHLVVVAGTATVTVNGEVVVLAESQSMQLAAGAGQRVEYATEAPLRIIEVQCGDPVPDDRAG
jgi:mannose-1-phosphate guanylyltransferase/mannose-6-phosphate isomerase